MLRLTIVPAIIGLIAAVAIPLCQRLYRHFFPPRT